MSKTIYGSNFTMKWAAAIVNFILTYPMKTLGKQQLRPPSVEEPILWTLLPIPFKVIKRHLGNLRYEKIVFIIIDEKIIVIPKAVFPNIAG